MTDMGTALANERGAMEIAVTTAAESVKAAMVIAQRFPRNEEQARLNILRECEQLRLAEDAEYEYPRGDELVTGPSIRLAEMLSRRWGHFDQGVLELDRRGGQSICLAYAWDLQTNTRDARTFTVRHWRDRKGGAGYAITSERDIYEVIANQAARRKRAAILALIPGWLVDEAVERCRKTLATKSTDPIEVRIERMKKSFLELGVTDAMIEERLGQHLANVSEHGMTKLRRLYASLRDGIATVGELFPAAEAAAAAPAPSKLDGMTAKLTGAETKPVEREPPAPVRETPAPVRETPAEIPPVEKPRKRPPPPAEKPKKRRKKAEPAEPEESGTLAPPPAAEPKKLIFMTDKELSMEIDRLQASIDAGGLSSAEAKSTRARLLDALDILQERQEVDAEEARQAGGPDG